MEKNLSLYSILGLECDATGEAIETTYRERHEVLQQSGGDSDALSLLRVAYDTLKNPVLRQRYDARQKSLAAASAAVVFLPDTPELRFGGHRRSGRNLLMFVLILLVGLAYWRLWPRATPARPPTPVAVVDTPSQREEPPSEAPSAAPNETALEPLPLPLPPPPQPLTGIREDASPQMETVTRPARSPGFDVKYLAWSAHYVVRPGAMTGSGVMVAPDKILTNCHVLAGAGLSGVAVMNSVTRKVAKVKEYARLEDDDVCLLHAPGAGSDAIEWGSSASLKSGDATHTFGHPGGSRDLIWSSGVFVRRLPVSGRGEDVLVTNNYCRPGSSGGPLLDGEGRLVGVVTAVQRFTSQTQENAYGLCVSVTEATARELLRKPLFPIAMAPSFYKKNY